MASVTDRDGEALSLKLRIEVQLHGFSAHSEAWVERLAVAEFASGLRKLEEARSGEALLQGEDPEDLELKVSSLDRVGHMLLEFRVTRLTAVGDQGRPISVQLSGGFELDPGLLPGLVAGVTRLTALLHRAGLKRGPATTGRGPHGYRDFLPFAGAVRTASAPAMMTAIAILLSSDLFNTSATGTTSSSVPAGPPKVVETIPKNRRSLIATSASRE